MFFFFPCRVAGCCCWSVSRVPAGPRRELDLPVEHAPAARPTPAAGPGRRRRPAAPGAGSSPTAGAMQPARWSSTSPRPASRRTPWSGPTNRNPAASGPWPAPSTRGGRGTSRGRRPATAVGRRVATSISSARAASQPADRAGVGERRVHLGPVADDRRVGHQPRHVVARRRRRPPRGRSPRTRPGTPAACAGWSARTARTGTPRG